VDVTSLKKHYKMQYKIFTLPIYGSEEMNEEMNKFLRAHRIVNVERKLVERSNGDACWSFCIEYVDGLAAAPGNTWQRKEKIDYKMVLDEQTFTHFSRLREIRKQIADSDAVPAYAVFTDAELAEIAALPEKSPADLQKIEGIGAKKVEKYGETLCNLFNENASQE